MPNITYKKEGDTIIHLYDGVKKYEHFKNSNGFESWVEYNEKGNEIHYKDSNGFESWSEYNKKGKQIHSKDSNGYELCSEYNEKGKQIHCKDSDGNESWSEDHPDNPKNKLITSDSEPFTFNK